MSWDITTKADGKTIELRKTFTGPPCIDRYGYTAKDYGQMLIIVSKGNRVRFSMNGPCNLSNSEFTQMCEQIRAAQLQLT